MGVLQIGISAMVIENKVKTLTITTFRTGKLDFEDVCFVKELQHFNLFSVSQMCDKKNKVLFIDTECLVGDIIEFCGSKEIKREYSNAITPQQNGVAERKNRTLIEAARTMLADSFLPNTFWAESVSTACYVVIVEAEPAQEYYVLPLWSSYTSTVKSSETKNGGEKPKKDTNLKSNEKPVDKEEQAFLGELERLKRQEKDTDDAAEALRKEFSQNTEDLLLQATADRATSTKIVNTVNTPVNTASSTRIFCAGETSNPDTTNYADQDDS
ncbi:putative ribonuclease H-like domain-containing protein [Tanacetum coccineum]|uniref:Ribonuclease H-like domain-containing protein n=1 Tax=Tanacetum coccineum TaxID=301880 RepID=A0ABQ5E5Y4_9ASTR